MGADLVMLATPELGGLPYVVSGLVAAGGLAAALSTADGLLLTISNALVRDMYYAQRMRRTPGATSSPGNERSASRRWRSRRPYARPARRQGGTV